MKYSFFSIFSLLSYKMLVYLWRTANLYKAGKLATLLFWGTCIFIDHVLQEVLWWAVAFLHTTHTSAVILVPPTFLSGDWSERSPVSLQPLASLNHLVLPVNYAVKITFAPSNLFYWTLVACYCAWIRALLGYLWGTAQPDSPEQPSGLEETNPSWGGFPSSEATQRAGLELNDL